MQFIARSWREGVRIFWTLFRLAFPLLLVVRLLDEYFNIVSHVGGWMAPLMDIVGLPGETGVVFATGMLLQIYTAILVLPLLPPELELSVAQMTVLMTMVLVAHGLPVELRIVQKAGFRLPAALLLRVGGAFMLGWLLHLAYGDDWLQQPVEWAFLLPPSDDGWSGWALAEARNWLAIFAVVQVLVLFVNVMKATHAEKVLIVLCAPLFRLLGVGEKTTTMVIIGMLLGLSYGGGLLIEESRRRGMNRREVLCVMALLCLCHSIVEDTLLVMLTGAHVSGVLFGRVIFSVMFMIIFSRLLAGVSDSTLGLIYRKQAVR